MSAPSPLPFRHTPLPSTGKWIRLLHLKSLLSSLNDEISLEGTLFEVRLECPRRYEALSYTWGVHSPDQTILINKQPFAITRNLHDALSQLRGRHTRRTIWVDALCISQSDPVEKSKQVNMIGDIFQEAERVMVWLGPNLDGSERLFTDAYAAQDCSGGRLSEGDETLAVIWLKFFGRDYWSRTWIVQEIVLAQSVLVFCGIDQMYWTQLMRRCLDPPNDQFFDSYRNLPFDPSDARRSTLSAEQHNQIEQYEEGLDRVRVLEARRKQLRSRDRKKSTAPSTDIFDLIIAFKDTHCADKRDKVYALLSLSSGSPVIQPDYSISAEQLFINLCGDKMFPNDDEFMQLTDTLGLYNLESYYAILCLLLKGGDTLDTNLHIYMIKVFLVNISSFFYKNTDQDDRGHDEQKRPEIETPARGLQIPSRKELAIQALTLKSEIERAMSLRKKLEQPLK